MTGRKLKSLEQKEARDGCRDSERKKRGRKQREFGLGGASQDRSVRETDGGKRDRGTSNGSPEKRGDTVC